MNTENFTQVPNRYFNTEDYTAISDAGRTKVDEWLKVHNLMELRVAVVSDNPGGSGLVISGFGEEYDPEDGPILSQFDHKVVATLEVDDFPWDVLDTIQQKENI